MPVLYIRDVAAKRLAAFVLFTIVAFAATRIRCAVAFVAVRRNNADRAATIRQNPEQPQRPVSLRLGDSNPNFGYEYIPPNPDASPGSFHTPSLRSSYPPDTPPGLRGEAVRSALVSTERCIGWNLSSNLETSPGGLLEISGRGTLEFLNGKLTRDFRACVDEASAYREACLLDAKGRVVDVLRVTMADSNCRALVLTSPGHSSADLMKRLDPFVFPMDEVALTNFCNDGQNGDNRSFAFTLASTQYRHVQKAMREQANLPLSGDEMVFPGSSQGVVWKPANNHDVQILVVPSTGVPSIACVGYTFVFFGSGSSAADLGRQVWGHLIGEENLEGPVEVGALEYETLRIEAGQPAYGHEFGIDRDKQREEEAKAAVEDRESGRRRRKKAASSSVIKTGPYELHFGSLVDLDKGCYLGQEGVASVLKNPRGAPRNLYTVVFEDDFNIYESQSRGDKSSVENLTTLPKPGQKLYALGSNEELEVGTLTSMGEAGGTGNRLTVGLALVRRADSIRKKMEKFGLEIQRDTDDLLNVDFSSGSGIIQPPPMDPLDGLEVIVEGTFTMGVLRSVPSRQSGARRNSNMFDEDIEVEGIEEQEPGITSWDSAATPISTDASSIDDIYDDDDDSLEKIEAEMAKAAAEAETAAAEARRKAEKMELLKKRAEEALARRQQKKAEKEKEKADSEDAAAAEAKRKAEKMAMLQKRAEEAMARRKQKKAASSSADETQNDNKLATTTEEDFTVAEAQRKAEKMEMLKKRAEEAMARRQQKKGEQ